MSRPSVSDAKKISAIWNVGVQLFEHLYGRHFQAIPEAAAVFMKQFAILPSINFLCLHSSLISTRFTMFKLGDTDHALFISLHLDHDGEFTKAMKLFVKRKGQEVISCILIILDLARLTPNCAHATLIACRLIWDYWMMHSVCPIRIFVARWLNRYLTNRGISSSFSTIIALYYRCNCIIPYQWRYKLIILISCPSHRVTLWYTVIRNVRCSEPVEFV